MSLINLIDRKLELEAAGLYHPNQFLIQLDASNPFIVGRGSAATQQMEYLDVFIHEYWHYLQNVTTIAGFQSLMFTRDLLSYFSHSLLTRANGTSTGSQELNADQITQVSNLVHLRNVFEGQPAPNSALRRDNNLHFTVRDIREYEDHWQLRGRSVPNPITTLDVRAEWPDGTIRNYEMALGAISIEESVAFLVGEQFREELGLRELEMIPAFPYRVAERVYEYIVDRTPASTYFPAALATLALLTNRPGPYFIQLVRLFRGALDRNLDERQSLGVVTQMHRDAMRPTIETIINHEIPDLEGIHENRGMLEGAINHLSQTFRRALDRRSDDPLFDLQVAFPSAHHDGWQQLVRDYPPCDLLQEYRGDDQQLLRDQLYRFPTASAYNSGNIDNNNLRSFQAQDNYLESHISLVNGRFISSDSTQARCPFFTACELPLRSNNRQICQERPWLAYQHSGNGGCWYYNAVISSLGTVRQSLS